MPSSIIPIDTYVFRETDNLLFDTNIWFYLYGPQGKSDAKTTTYSKALKQIISAKSRIVVNILILSEFANRYARNEFNKWKGKGPVREFKGFRRHPDFLPIAQGIEVSIRKILSWSEKISTGFEKLDMNALLATFDSQKLDFNDMILVNLCKEKDLMFVTHDGDFADSGITILTANQTLLL